MNEKAHIEVDIGELCALIEWNYLLFSSIKPEDYLRINAAGSTMGNVALKHKVRAEKLRYLMDETWPK